MLSAYPLKSKLNYNPFKISISALSISKSVNEYPANLWSFLRAISVLLIPKFPGEHFEAIKIEARIYA